MPLPLLLTVPAVIAGVIGIGVVLEEIEKNEFEDMQYRDDKIIRDSLDKIRSFSDNCIKMLRLLIKSEVQIINSSMKEFIVELEKLNNTEFAETIYLKELKALAIKKGELIKAKESQLQLFVKVASDIGNTFIGKVNPRVCKLKSYKACLKYIEIRKRVAMFHRNLLLLNANLEQHIYKMKQIITEKGTDFSRFSIEEQNIINEAMALAIEIKSILDMPIFMETGGLLPEPK